MVVSRGRLKYFTSARFPDLFSWRESLRFLKISRTTWTVDDFLRRLVCSVSIQMIQRTKESHYSDSQAKKQLSPSERGGKRERDLRRVYFFLTETVQNNNYYMEYALTQTITGEYYHQMVPLENHCLPSLEKDRCLFPSLYCNVSQNASDTNWFTLTWEAILVYLKRVDEECESRPRQVEMFESRESNLRAAQWAFSVTTTAGQKC